MLKVEFNGRALESSGLGCCLGVWEILGKEILGLFICFGLGFFPPPLMSVSEEGDGQVLVKLGSVKISLSTFEILGFFPQCEGRDFLRERNETK